MARIVLIGALLSLVLAACGNGVTDSADTGEASPFRGESWETDFSEHSVPLDDFMSGGPPKDGIPSIDDPKFVSVEEADEFLDPREPVAVLQLGGEVRAYPIQILIWHEIVNDEIAGRPVAVTYCPLCNSTVAFGREIDGEAVEFGTTGKLRNSDLVMYDRDTESWWQQLTAEAVVGERTGEKLDVLPSQILSWDEVRRLHPDARVLSRNTGFDRDYGTSPYGGYDSNPDSQPFLLEGKADTSLPPKERVASVRDGESAVVYPFSSLRKRAPVNDEVDGEPVVVFFDPEVASALDSTSVAAGRDAGAAAVFKRRLDGRTLEFSAGPEPGTFRDRETGSTWDMSGTAIEGELEGSTLKQVPHDDQFWFALAAFFEDAEIRGR